ncbi:rhodanese-like domain-containing protein [Azospirillum sp. B510]|uniref:rhodanese-like domain-containing protein n=1 Tax=Azospirillum sp. (strain B510) TaxID=137722 RepID=UPI0005AACFB5|nr:rhodanese-like domain-containing protein [Azospirillum sp. B510]
MRSLVFAMITPVLLAGCQTSGAGGQSAAQSAGQVAAKPYSAEDKDWGIAPQTTIRQGNYHAPTPVSLPGAKVVATHALAQSLQGEGKPVIVNTLTGQWVNAIPGSVWLSGAGLGKDFNDATQARLSKRLDDLTAGDKTKPLVFYCLSSECWLSLNAALRAQRIGYTNVSWFRGGLDSWKAAGLPVERIDRDQW